MFSINFLWIDFFTIDKISEPANSFQEAINGIVQAEVWSW